MIYKSETYATREYWIAQLEVDFSAGDICDKEYSGERWMDEDARPRAGGRCGEDGRDRVCV